MAGEVPLVRGAGSQSGGRVVTRLAWHFLHPDNKLRDGRDAPPGGEWLVHDGPVVPCESGLHASEQAIDALKYAPYEHKIVLCRVELRGTVIEHGEPVDKLAASERRILWRLDGDTTDRVLREFARWSASQVLHLWNAPPVEAARAAAKGSRQRRNLGRNQGRSQGRAERRA